MKKVEHRSKHGASLGIFVTMIFAAQPDHSIAQVLADDVIVEVNGPGHRNFKRNSGWIPERLKLKPLNSKAV